MQDSILAAMKASFNDYLSLSPSFFVSGAVVTETTVSPTTVSVSVTEGVVFLDGEPMPVASGSILMPVSHYSYLAVVDVPDDVTPLLNVDGQTDYVRRKRRAVLGSASIIPVGAMSLSSPRKGDLDRIRMKGRLVPKGTIVPYFGDMTMFSASGMGLADTPMEGWAVCNGLNGTVDMRGMTPFGATAVPSTGAGPVYSGVGVSTNPGDESGADFTLLEPDNLPAHAHPYQDAATTWPGGSGVDGGGSLNPTNVDSTRTSGDNATSHDPVFMKPASKALVFIQSVV